MWERATTELRGKTVRDELKGYYERELTFLRQMGQEFAEKHPKIARRLVLEANDCNDPHAERMIESFALLAARVHLRLDDDFPQITQALLNVLYPHFLRPVPSISIVEFQSDPERGKLTSKLLIPKGTPLDYAQQVNGVTCKFRTCYDAVLWPLRITAAQWLTPDRLNPPLRAPEAAAVLRVELECFPDVSLESLELDTFRFYLSGESAPMYALYELLCKNCVRVVARDPGNPKAPPRYLTGRPLRPVGFGEDEEVIPYPRRSFLGYRLLQEYFAFPYKFLFVDLTGLTELRGVGLKSRVEILFLVSPSDLASSHYHLEAAVDARTLRLACAPIINLFERSAEPILVDQTHYEYPIVPDARHRDALEVYSVNEVFSTDPETQQRVEYLPLYSQRFAARDSGVAYWYTRRQASSRRGDEGTDLLISFVDLSSRPMQLDYDTVSVRCTCTNRDLVARLPFGGSASDLEMPGSAMIKKIVVLRKPSPALRPALEGRMLWYLVSHLSLNDLSLVDEGKEALQTILALYDFAHSPEAQKQIAGLISVSSRRHFTRLPSEHNVTFARGLRVEMEFDEEQFSGVGLYLFASVIERFLGLYTSMNSFSQLVARSRQRREPLAEWPPRAGQSILM